MFPNDQADGDIKASQLDTGDKSKTLVGKADDATALLTLFNIDMEAIGAMMSDPEFHKMTEN